MDLAKPSVKIALCQEQVPCGATAKKVFEKAKITVMTNLTVAALTSPGAAEAGAPTMAIQTSRYASARAGRLTPRANLLSLPS
ncbi:hypothetical protein [Cryptosporangium sp. NPDC048952]|uniref:hypothetical protein n=1 Tax=Cryptosporangium sp. NPDC048952 TaxID=3363961 RepID=UPI0037207272